MADPAAAKYSFDEYAAASLEFVRANAGNPFFLYLPFTPPHGALEVPELGDYARRDWPYVEQKIWAAMITRMDAAIGRLMALLKELGLDEDTAVFFTSDNGYSAASYGADNALDNLFHHRGPWLGRKGDLHQGGLRVPTVARWPGRIAPGTVSDHVWAFWDFLPTAAEIAGAEKPPRTDGLSILPTLLGQPERQKQHEHLYWQFSDEQALRMGEWWIHRKSPSSPIRVTHANEDPAEERDLASEKPEVAKRAEEIFRAEHEPTPYAPSPGENRESWHRRAQAAGVSLPHNVDTW